MSIFNSVQIPKVPRSRFNLSHYKNLTADYGRLYPFLFIDCVPNDTFKLGAQVLVNTAPMITAPYTQNDVRLDYFFVPYRLLWDNWKDFITGGEDGLQEPVLPYVSTFGINDSISGLSAKNILSYLGVNSFLDSNGLPVFNNEALCSLPLRAYALIWNEWYRDQNIQDEIDISKTSDGEDSDLINSIFNKYNDDGLFLYRSWRKDYFTSALPSPQRGVEVPINFDTNISIPVEFANDLANLRTSLSSGTTVPVGSMDFDTMKGYYLRVDETGHIKLVDQTAHVSATPNVYGPVSLSDVKGIAAPLGEWLSDLIENQTRDENGFAHVNSVDLPAITINDLRRANAIQIWLERNMRAGARYVEQILSHFGVRVPDYRLDRPEYLGGEQFPVQISQIFQNSESSEDSAIGSYGGKGMASVSARIRKYRVEEHGCIIGLMSILPKAVYSSGINHFFLQRDKFDFYFPEFANLGEQEIKTKELSVTSDMVDENNNLADSTFGYTPRYAHMKFISNSVCGDFLYSGMSHFTQYRKFQSEPTLSQEFLTVTPTSDGINRIWAVEDVYQYDHFWVTVFNQVHAKRPMPKYGTPKLIG